MATHLTNPLATVDQLYRRTTSFGTLPSDLQEAIFFATQSLTQAAGLLLRLPQSVTAQANVVLARYWLVDSLLANEFSDVSAATLFLIAKLSSHPTRPRDICNVYAYLLSPSSPLFRPKPSSSSSSTSSTNDPQSYYLSESAFTSFHSRTLRLEARILYTLGFDTHVALPHGLAITYLQALDVFNNGASGKDLAARVVALLNTALLSPQMLYLTHQPNALAVAAIYSAAREGGDDGRKGVRMPDCAWWEVFDVDREELGFLIVGMRSLDGWVRSLKETIPGFGATGMFTVKDCEAEMRRRGLSMGNGSMGRGEEVMDEEEAMMRSMDERADEMEI
ncbi:cyclin-like protein [Xylariaceae sp. FL0255]|nr:cyclin-like protein [Xylariaceae sp. FL0255]